jgi:hypothetical protein
MMSMPVSCSWAWVFSGSTVGRRFDDIDDFLNLLKGRKGNVDVCSGTDLNDGHDCVKAFLLDTEFGGARRKIFEHAASGEAGFATLELRIGRLQGDAGAGNGHGVFVEDRDGEGGRLRGETSRKQKREGCHAPRECGQGTHPRVPPFPDPEE